MYRGLHEGGNDPGVYAKVILIYSLKAAHINSDSVRKVLITTSNNHQPSYLSLLV